MSRAGRWAAFSLAAASLAPVPAMAAAVSLVENGQPRAAVILPAAPAALEEKAAAELVEHIRLISGAELPVVSGGPAPTGLLPVRLGDAAPAALAEKARALKDNPSSFALTVEATGLAIRGVAPEGTAFGVYELLEQLGVRWYLPGDLGRVIPRMATVGLAAQETVQAPSTELRLIQTGQGMTGWSLRNRRGGLERSTGSHGIHPFRGRASREQLFASNPEYFALIDGQRRLRQICPSNPGTVALAAAYIRQRHEPTAERFYIGMGPNDGGGYCECEPCLALDGGVYDPLYSVVSRTGRYIWFFNRLLETLEDDYPDLHIAWYVYASHMMPPPPELTPDPRIVGVFAPISIDRIRGMDNPMSPDRHVLRWVIDRWSALEPNELNYRGYYNNLACVQLPISQVDRIRHEKPVFYEKGIRAMRIEVIRQSWAGNAVTLYLAARLMWDVNTDVDALLAEFYDQFYGPAAGPMGQYWEAIDAAFRDTPHFTGCSYVYFPIFDAPRRAALRRQLTEAAGRTARHRGHEPYAERVRVARLAFDRMELFLDLIAARNRHDYATAYRLMQSFNELTDAMVDYVLEGEGRRAHRLMHWNERSDNPGSYFNRFFERPISSGWHRTVEAGELVAGLPDEWDFLLDPSGIGELGGWQRPGPLGGNWQRLKTTSRSWSDQGLHYYKGKAWYRTEVEIPARFRGRRIYLWLGGVDNVATAWINGQFLGTSREPGEGLPGVPGSFRPFDVEATSALRFGPGETNTVTIRVDNHSIAELGTGGITAPVMLWSPHDAAWTP